MIRVSGVVSRRGTRSVSPEDLLFLLRHDVNRSARLKEFLSWKDVRKNAKATGGGEMGGTDGGAATSEVGHSDDSALVAEIEEDAKTLAAVSDLNQDFGSDSFRSSNFEGSSVDPSCSKSSSTVQIGPKRRQLGLFWDLGHGLLADLPGGICSSGSNSAFTDGTSLTSYDSREQATCQQETLRRLRHADLITLSMSQSEYLEYSECRQASFTYKKARKFREWLVGGTARPGCLSLSTLAGGNARDLSRLNDDTLEILGFLAYEIVQKLTEVSLAVKYEKEKQILAASTPANSTSSLSGVFVTTTSISTSSIITSKSLSTVPKTPIQVQHVEEAYRKLISANIDVDNLFRHSINKKRKFIL